MDLIVGKETNNYLGLEFWAGIFLLQERMLYQLPLQAWGAYQTVPGEAGSGSPPIHPYRGSETQYFLNKYINYTRLIKFFFRKTPFFINTITGCVYISFALLTLSSALKIMTNKITVKILFTRSNNKKY